MSQNLTSLLVRFLTSVAALALSVGLGVFIVDVVAGLAPPDWVIWASAIAYLLILAALYLGLKRTKFGKYLWTLPDGITW